MFRATVHSWLLSAKPHLHVGSSEAEGPKTRLNRTTMMVLDMALG